MLFNYSENIKYMKMEYVIRKSQTVARLVNCCVYDLARPLMDAGLVFRTHGLTKQTGEANRNDRTHLPSLLVQVVNIQLLVNNSRRSLFLKSYDPPLP